MVLRLNTDKKVVGSKQVRLALTRGEAKLVYIAQDASERVVKDIIEKCAEKEIKVIYVETMGKLGEACNIDVNAASAALLK